MKTIIINGLALGFAKNITGIQRACHELIYRMDKQLNEISDLTVKYVYNVDDLNYVIDPSKLINIKAIPVKHDGKRFWKTRVLRKIVKQENATLCCMSLETVFLRNQISFIYDIRAVTTKFDTLKFRLKYKIFMFLQKINAKYYLTDSNFQKEAIKKYQNINDNQIETLYMGYEHTESVVADYGIFDKFPMLNENDYFYTLGSLAPHKNVLWVAEVAKRNPNYIFAIAGGKDLKVWNDNVEIKGIDNLLFLGYVSDEESRALSEKCIAFLHPSKYEGFGIPPLEALCYGAKVILSNATCLPEVYENCAVYFDPDDYEVNLKDLCNVSVADYKKICEKCSWDKSATKLIEVFRRQ